MRKVWERFLRSPGARGKGEEVGPGVSVCLPALLTFLGLRISTEDGRKNGPGRTPTGGMRARQQRGLPRRKELSSLSSPVLGAGWRAGFVSAYLFPPLALFIVMLPKAHLTLHCRMSGLGECSYHCGYLGHEDLLCIVLCIFFFFF